MRGKLFAMTLLLTMLYSCSPYPKVTFPLKPMAADPGTTTSQENPTNIGVTPDKTNTYVIEYDFQQGTYKRNNMPLILHHPVVYKITNINRLAYEVVIKSKDSVLADSNFNEIVADQLAKERHLESKIENKIATEKALNEAFAPKITDEDFQRHIDASKMSEIRKQLMVINKSRLLSGELQLLKDNENQLKKERTYVTEEISRLSDAVGLTQNIIVKSSQEKELGANIIKLQQLEYQITDAKKVVSDKEAAIKTQNDQNTEDLQSFASDFTIFRSTFQLLSDAYERIHKIHQINYELHEASRNPLLTLEKYNEEFGAKEANIRSGMHALPDESQLFARLYRTFIYQYNILANNLELNDLLNYGGRTKLLAPVETIKDMGSQMNSEVTKLDIAKLIHRIKCNLDLLADADSFVFVSAPVQPTNDVAVFDVAIQMRAGYESEVLNSRKYNHKEYTKGGVRLDLGLGLGLQYFDNAPSYGIVNSDTANKITQTAASNYFASIIGMATIAFRKAGIFSPGISAGLGLSVADGKIQTNNFFVGPSLIIGRYERLCITSGATVKALPVLKPGYSVGHLTGEITDISSFVEDKIKIGAFLSLTYNLTQGVRNNLKKIK